MITDKDAKNFQKMIDKLEKKETYKPLPDSLYIGESKIHGQGLIAKENISEGTDLGVSHYKKNDQFHFRVLRTRRRKRKVK